MEVTMEVLLREMVAQGASDLHLRPGNYPGFRIDGHVRQQEQFGKLGPDCTKRLAYEVLNDHQQKEFEELWDLDFSHALPGIARFRFNLHKQRNSVAVVARTIPDRVPTASSLGLPEVCLELARQPRGLVLVTGATGSGKSTTLAAMIDHINETMLGHILTMEDPIEFIHPDKQCFVTQRQVGRDTKSFAEALRRALRQDPDVILIGEMRDLETISLAITAAETGHLVLGTLHTTSAISTVDRILDAFPHEQQSQVRVQLSGTLRGIVSQCLVPKIGGGRVAAQEILVATDAVKALIREGKTAQMLNQLQTGQRQGMSTLEMRLIDLVNSGKITLDDAIAKANRPEEVMKQARPGTQRATPQAAPAAPSARPSPQPVAAQPTASEQSRPRPARPRGDDDLNGLDDIFAGFKKG